jgi:hypothetical protein
LAVGTQNKSFGMAAIYARLAGMPAQSAVQTIQLFQGRVQLVECAFDGAHPALLIGREPARRVVSIALTSISMMPVFISA